MVPYDHGQKASNPKDFPGKYLFCKKCGSGREMASVKRRFCHGSWWKSLLGYECTDKVGHFHHECPHCGFKWSELTREAKDEQVLAHVVVIAKRLGILLEAWRHEVVKDVMDA